MIVVSDTSALTYLIQINQVSLLFDLYQTVVAPVRFAMELLVYHSIIPNAIRVDSVRDFSTVVRLLEDLDAGEKPKQSRWQKQLDEDLLLMDENLGRKIAEAEGLKIIGTLGVLVQPRLKGFLRQPLSPILDQLETIGFFISDDLRASVLRSVDEA